MLYVYQIYFRIFEYINIRIEKILLKIIFNIINQSKITLEHMKLLRNCWFLYIAQYLNLFITIPMTMIVHYYSDNVFTPYTAFYSWGLPLEVLSGDTKLFFL